MNIRKFVRKMISEAFATEHYTIRLYDRFLNRDTISVGFEITGAVGQYEVVGTYKLPNELKSIIIENSKFIESNKFPLDKSYGIKIAEIKIDKSLVKYKSDALRVLSEDKELIVVDKETESNGNLIYLIIRKNEISTVFFAKSYVHQNASKMRVDVIINNINNIKNKEQKNKDIKTHENPKEYVININGVKWVVNAAEEKIYKKNSPEKKYDVYEFLETQDEEVQDKAMSFIVKEIFESLLI